MSIVLKFRKNVTDLSLMGGAAGLQLADSGWRALIATPVEGMTPSPIIETMELECNAANQNTLATYLQNLHAMQVGAEQYIKDRTAEYPVWLHAKLDNETGERRVLVRKIETAFVSGWFGASAIDSKAALALSVERHPWWEGTAKRDLPSASPSAAAAVVYDYTAAGASVSAHNIVGDVPARVEHFRMQSNTAAFTLDRAWVGIRSAAKHGILANFQPVWECENGANTARGSDAGDGTASGGNKVVGTPSAGNTWEKYFTLELQDVTSNYADNLGRFLWMLRHKVSASCTYEIQLRFGYNSMADADFVQGPIKETISTSWDYLALGSALIPPLDLQARQGVLGTVLELEWSIQVWVRRTAGSSTIEFDCFCPIPTDEGWLIMSNMGAVFNSTAGYIESPHGHGDAYGGSGSSIETRPVWEAQSFRLPPGDGRMVIVYAREVSSVLTDSLIFSGATDTGGYYERWSSLRGSE